MRARQILLAFLTIFMLGILITYHRIEELREAGSQRFYLQVLPSSGGKEGRKKYDAKESSRCSTGHAYPWNGEKPMGVLLLRGLSFIGFHISKRLLEEGHRITILDSFHGNHMIDSLALHGKDMRLEQLTSLRSPHLRVINNDPCDMLIVRKMLKKFEFTHIVFIPEDINPHETARKSMNETLFCLSRILERIKLHSYIHFTLLSSLSVHFVENSVPTLFKTSHALSHHNYYTIMHSAMENVLEFYHFLYQIPITCMRLGKVYGEWMDLSDPMLFLLEKTLHRESQDKTLDLSDGDFTPSIYYANQSILHVNDVVHVLEKVMHKRYYCEYFDVSSKEPSSLEAVHSNLMQISKGLHTPTHASHQNSTVLQYFGVSRPVHSIVHYKKCTHSSHIRAILPEWSLPLKEGLRQMVHWYEGMLDKIYPQGNKDLIFTSYFTSSKDPQRKVRNKDNNFDYMKTWYYSLQEVNLQSVIFHDGLNERFTSRLVTADIKFSFANLNQRSTNDARFYIYRDYLIQNPDVQRVILTDISDVKFLRNPFELMDVLGNFLYIGTDIDFFPNMESMGWLKKRMPECFGEMSVEYGSVSKVKKYRTVYNAGVIGGSRSVMLEFLRYVTDELDRTPPELNCNMPVVNYVVHRYFDERVFTGFPWTSKFYQRQSAPVGVFMIHK